MSPMVGCFQGVFLFLAEFQVFYLRPSWVLSWPKLLQKEFLGTFSFAIVFVNITNNSPEDCLCHVAATCGSPFARQHVKDLLCKVIVLQSKLSY